MCRICDLCPSSFLQNAVGILKLDICTLINECLITPPAPLFVGQAWTAELLVSVT